MRTEAHTDLGESVARAAAVLREEGAAEVYVFGSAAAGTAREGSDIDIAIRGLPPRRFFRALARAADAAGREIDLVDLDADTPFARHLCTTRDCAVSPKLREQLTLESRTWTGYSHLTPA
jgi:predicted nucleotidyltransferase